MSKNISVKINNGNETIETVKLNAASKKVIIKAQPNVNYELVDEATQYAPEMIDTKRVGNDLHIAFEGTDINKESDLVLEGYYEHDNTELLLGMAEDGQYYAYVPQSGMESDAVTLLADQVFAPQALGGNSVAAPFWAFNPNWLWVAAGVAAVGGIIAAASGSSGSGSSNKATDKPSDNTDKNNNSSNNDNTAKDTTAPAKPSIVTKHDGSVEITPPADADTKSVEVSYTDEAGTAKTATITKGADGAWTSDNPDVTVESATGKATIPADKVQDGSPVKAKATDNAGNTGKEGTANAGNNPDTTAPSAPEVTPSTEDGSVTVKVPSDAQTGDTVEVTVTPEGSDTPEKVTLTKNANGSWTSDKPETVPSIDAGKDSTTIPEDKVKDGSKVTAQAKDPAGNESTPTTVTAGNDKPSAPTVTASTEDGSVTVAVPDDAKEGDVLNIAVEGENDNAPTSVSLTKQSDGSWTSSNPNIVPNIEVGKNSTTIPQDNIKDGSDINAMISRGNVISAQATAQAGSDKVVKLELSLAEDTGASSSDNYTKNGQVNVSGIPSGSEWEYSTDGGQTWNSGSGNSFTLPNNTKVGGIAYSLQARVKGNAASTSDTLNMTLDQKAGEFHAIIDGDMNLIGTAEKNSTISINNRSGKANANGEFEVAGGAESSVNVRLIQGEDASHVRALVSVKWSQVSPGASSSSSRGSGSGSSTGSASSSASSSSGAASASGYVFESQYVVALVKDGSRWAVERFEPFRLNPAVS